MTVETPGTQSAEDSRFHVVGVGASAGGLDALERFFTNVPTDSGMSFVVVQHLSPDFRSLMDELLARRTRLPIFHVEDGMPVLPDHIYLIPPKKEMIISAGRLLLSERDDNKQELSLPIDVFFRSLAQDCGDRAVAVVLSGGGSDGSRGVKAVRDVGGLVVVQDADSAQFDGMPRNARDAGVATFVLAPEKMPSAILDHLRAIGKTAPEKDLDETVPGLDSVYRMLASEYGIDFKHYKPSTVTRRIERRLRMSRLDTLEDYVERLRTGRGELDQLYRDLLIGVTRFFRNDEAFNLLETKVLPEALGRRGEDPAFRVWVAGCATGEEVYSLAIVLHEIASRQGDRPIKIFATDVHKRSLDHAANAIYDEHAVSNISRDRLDRYFLKRGKAYQIVPDLRQCVVFAQHNVVKDPPFTRVDLVSCRNMLIYLQPAAQRKVLGLFHFALHRNGVLFLGPSESPGTLSHDFATVDGHWRIYKKRSDVRTPVDARFQPARSIEFRPPSGPETPLARFSVSRLLDTYDALLGQFMPPSLLVSDRGELLHAFGGASTFLRIRDGRHGLEVSDLVDGELRMVLIGGLQRALKEQAAIVFRNVRLSVDGKEQAYTVTIRRINGRSGTPNLVITFETPRDREQQLGERERELDGVPGAEAQLGALEEELSHTREHLQAAIEELETSNEELQAANEELIASNEELQSTNEELQSVNEELYTVNAEYQRKIGELTELTNDMDNLLTSTDIGTIFLDKQLRIRKFTPQIAESFNLLPQDISRPISAFASNIGYDDLARDLELSLGGERLEREVHDRLGRSLFMRILPYRARGAAEGVVLTLIDVSSLRAAEDALFHERYLLNSLLASVPDAIYFKDAHGKFIRVNRHMAARLGVDSAAEVEGKTAFDLPNHELVLALHRQDQAVLAGATAQHYKLERREDENKKEQWDVVTRLPLHDRPGSVVGIIGIFRDYTLQKRAEEAIQESVRRRDQFLAMLSHELRNPLSAIVTATALLKGGGGSGPGKLVDIVDRQSRQMGRLIDDLLEATRVTQDKIELKKKLLDLRVVARDAADAAAGIFSARGVDFKLELAPNPVETEADPARIQQVIVNLLNNSAKYTQRGGHVLLTVKQEGGRAWVNVKDDGVGIPADFIDSIFELFVQSNRTLDRAEGGIGVGLTLVRSLVAMHGGSVRAKSDGDGRGSEFTVELPLSHHVGENEPHLTRLPGGGIAPGSTIVVVEDNVDGRELLCEFLSLAGYECHTAGEGLDGLALIEKIHPRVALVDIGLPGLDGLEVARRVRANPKNADILLTALTGYGQESDRTTVRRAGFDTHLVKPTDPDALVALLRGETTGIP